MSLPFDVRDDVNTPVIVLLAAGEGRRYGGLKQLADIEGQPMLRRTALATLECNVPVIVVTGEGADAVEAVLHALPLSVVRHDGWHEGMGSSLAAGIRRVQAQFPAASGALLCLADQPLVDRVVLTRMLARHHAAPGRILATGQSGVVGPPALFPRDCFATLSRWSGKQGAQALLMQEAARVERFFPRAGSDPCGIDVDTPDDLRRVRAWLAGHPSR